MYTNHPQDVITVVDHRPASNLSIALGNILASVGIRLANIISILVSASANLASLLHQ
jgi:hypothetical protein